MAPKIGTSHEEQQIAVHSSDDDFSDGSSIVSFDFVACEMKDDYRGLYEIPTQIILPADVPKAAPSGSKHFYEELLKDATGKIRGNNDILVCNVCGIEAEFVPDGMKRCDKCQEASYCSVECLEWDRSHIDDCCEKIKQKQPIQLSLAIENSPQELDASDSTTSQSTQSQSPRPWISVPGTIPLARGVSGATSGMSVDSSIFFKNPQRSFALESITRLGYHLAENVVEYLIKKVEKEEYLCNIVHQPLTLEVSVGRALGSCHSRMTERSSLSGDQSWGADSDELEPWSDHKNNSDPHASPDRSWVYDQERKKGLSKYSCERERVVTLGEFRRSQLRLKQHGVGKQPMAILHTEEGSDDSTLGSHHEFCSSSSSEVYSESLESCSQSSNTLDEESSTHTLSDDCDSSSESISDDSDSYTDFLDYAAPQMKRGVSDSQDLKRILPPTADSNPAPDEDVDTVSKLRQSRIRRALDSDARSEMTGTDTLTVESSNTNATSAPRSHFYTATHIGALCLIDISGFTKLSQVLELDSLSRTINSYFQMIIEEIRTYGGTVLKFAGDAIFAEWRACDETSSKPSQEDAVFMATACAVNIVNKCFEFPVKLNGNNVATLNVHCGVGLGNVVEAHVGCPERMEYLILGDTVRQVADALTTAKQGEVAASPEALERLSESVVFENSINRKDPQVIACKHKQKFRYKKNLPDLKSQKHQHLFDIVERCKEWSTPAIEHLQTAMSQYVHPVILSDEFRNTSGLGNKLHQSTAELREVFTVFFQPQISVDLFGKNAGDNEVIMLLNSIMLIVNFEVTRFKGQLRQFIADDKGLVVIANFGLRGSTFPNMIEERAIPCITNIKTLLKTELAIDCKLGATFGKAYCGVVGGTHRHEYAVLGPSVNLAARLMAYKENPGVLVDEAVKHKASSYPFQSLPSVSAKGYSKPVRIFKPEILTRKCWKGTSDALVGREKELSLFTTLAESVVGEKSSKILLVSAQHGYGKSSLLSHGAERIEDLFQSRSAQFLTARHIFCEEDSFQPFSIVRPLFFKLLNCADGGSIGDQTDEKVFNSSESGGISQPQVYVALLRICMEAQVPLHYVEIFGGLIFTKTLSEIGKWSDRDQKMSEWDRIAHWLVKVFLHCLREYELVLLAFDDVSGMDEMSWKIIERLYDRASNILLIGTCRNMHDMNIHPQFWCELIEDGQETFRFKHLQLDQLGLDDIRKLTGKVLGRRESEIDNNVARVVYGQSGGSPSIAIGIIKELYREKTECTLSSDGGVGELLLNRLDSLSPTARFHLNLGAILGSSFELDDLTTVLERYHSVQEEEKWCYTESVRNSLQEAVQLGILDVEENTFFTFTHEFWMQNITGVMLNSFKDDILTLFDEIKSGSSFKTQNHLDDAIALIDDDWDA